MQDFQREYHGVEFVGTIITGGPYPERLVLSPEEYSEDESGPLDWPDDDWVSAAAGEPVRHWTTGEGECEEVYLPLATEEEVAENARLMYGP